MGDFRRVAGVDDVPLGQGRVLEINGTEIAVFNVDGDFYAIGNVCTHRGGPLGEGHLRGKIVTCPWHGAQFDIISGHVVSPPAATAMPSYQTKIQDGAIWVEV